MAGEEEGQSPPRAGEKKTYYRRPKRRREKAEAIHTSSHANQEDKGTIRTLDERGDGEGKRKTSLRATKEKKFLSLPSLLGGKKKRGEEIEALLIYIFE